MVVVVDSEVVVCVVLSLIFEVVGKENFVVVVVLVVLRVRLVEVVLVVVVVVVVFVNLDNEFMIGVVELVVVVGVLRVNLVLVGVVSVLFNLNLFLRDSLFVVVVVGVVFILSLELGLFFLLLFLNENFDEVEVVVVVVFLGVNVCVGFIVVGVVVLFVLRVKFCDGVDFKFNLFVWVFGVLNIEFESFVGWVKFLFSVVLVVVEVLLSVKLFVNGEDVVFVVLLFREMFLGAVGVVVGVGLLNLSFDFF